MYPLRLIPHIGLKTNIDIDDLLEQGYGLCLARRFEGKLEDVFVEIGGILTFRDVDCALSELFQDVCQLSMTAMCYSIVPGDLKYEQKGTSHHDWDNKFHHPKEFKHMVFRCREFFVVYLNLKEIHGIGIPYERTFGSKKEFEDAFHVIEGFCQKLKNSFSRSTLYKISEPARFEVVHKPTMLNYFHFQTQISLIDGIIKSRKNNPNSYNYKDLLIRRAFEDILSVNFFYDAHYTQTPPKNFWNSPDVSPVRRMFNKIKNVVYCLYAIEEVS